MVDICLAVETRSISFSVSGRPDRRWGQSLVSFIGCDLEPESDASISEQ